jgi:beta-mannosidase
VVADLLSSHSTAETFARFLLTVNGKPMADRAIYFDHVRNLHLPARNIQHTWSTAGGKTLLTLRSATLARNVWIGFGDNDTQLSDNSLDLLPGIPVTVEVGSASHQAALEKGLQIMSLSDAFASPGEHAANNPLQKQGARD